MSPAPGPHRAPASSGNVSGDADQPEAAGFTVHGRHGSPTISVAVPFSGRRRSPTITVALPFSRIEMAKDPTDDAALREVVELVRRLAEAAAAPRASGREELEAVAAEATQLLARL